MNRRKQLFSLLACMMAIAARAIAQTPKIPEQQAHFCSILSNWKLRDGYAPGKEPPKADPNPINAARAPKPPDPGNIYDQLVAILGTSGEFTRWYGKVSYNVLNKMIPVNMQVYCPDVSIVSFQNSNDRRTWVPLNSPMADVLSKLSSGSMAIFSGNLSYDPGIKFYRREYNSGNPRSLPFGFTIAQSFFGISDNKVEAFDTQFTSISK